MQIAYFFFYLEEDTERLAIYTNDIKINVLKAFLCLIEDTIANSLLASLQSHVTFRSRIKNTHQLSFSQTRT